MREFNRQTQTKDFLVPKKITAFLGTFEDKLDRIRRKIKKEFDEAKEQGRPKDREFLKSELKLAKDLKKLIDELKDDHKVEIECPHCKEKFFVKK